MDIAASYGHLDIVKYLHENSLVVLVSFCTGQLASLQIMERSFTEMPNTLSSVKQLTFG